MRRRLRAMENDGQLVFTKRKCYALPEKLDLLKGMVIGHREGFGFLQVEGKKEDFFLATVTPADIRLEAYLGIVNGEAIIGANIFRDMFSSIRDVVGGRAGGYERALAGARQAALDEMKAAAKELGANGIIGIDFDYEVLGETNGMMMVVVSGTAVKVAV